MTSIPFRELTAALCLLAGGCASAGGPPIEELADEINATLAPSEFRLGPGDRLEVRFPYNLEWNQTVVVQPDGMATFVGLDAFPVAGALPQELDEDLSKRYADVLANPDLTVLVTEMAPRTVTVAGEIDSPGTVDLPADRRLTLVEAIARAGGHREETAHMSSTVLVRWDVAERRQKSWVLDARPKHWSGASPIFLQEYDLVYVPNLPIDVVANWLTNYVKRMIPIPQFFRPGS